MQKIDTNGIGKSISKAIDFLEANQLQSGEFCFYTSKSSEMTKNYKVPHCPFTTAFVLHSFKYSKSDERIEKIIDKAVKFLLYEKESPGIWRMSKTASYMPALDLDDTCLSLAALKEYGMNQIDYSFLAEYFKRYRSREGLFYTWIVENPEENNTIDSVVNANVLFFYSLQGQIFQDVLGRLNKILVGSELRKGKFESVYYPSPYALSYAFTRILRDGNVEKFNVPTSSIQTLVAEKLKSEIKSANELEIAMALNSLLNTGYKNDGIIDTLDMLINKQNSDGSWSGYPIFVGPLLSDPQFYYGSAELTTALSLEALAKYLYH